jgi:hypothetical protein
MEKKSPFNVFNMIYFSALFIFIFDVKEEPEAYFVTTIAICKGSPNAFALCKHNSFLSDPFLDGPPFTYSLYKELSLKDHI